MEKQCLKTQRTLLTKTISQIRLVFMQKTSFIIFLLIGAFWCNASPLEYNVQGKIVYKGKGVPGLKIGVYCLSEQGTQNLKINPLSGQDGSFAINLAKGEYEIMILGSEIYLTSPRNKKVIITDHDVKNIIIEVEKLCTISGTVTHVNELEISGSVVVQNPWHPLRNYTHIEGGRYKLEKILAHKDTSVTFIIEGIFNRIKRNVPLIEDGIIKEGVNLTVQPSFKIKFIIEAPNIKVDGIDRIRLYYEEEGIADEIDRRCTPGNSIVIANLKRGKYYIYWEDTYSRLLQITPIYYQGKGVQEIKVKINEHIKETYLPKFPTVYQAILKTRKLLESKLLSENANLHDDPLEYAAYADLSCIPFLIKVLKIIDKKYPEITIETTIGTQKGRICTYMHCIDALNMVAKEKLDFYEVTKWESWWQKRQQEKKNE
jgi:hypothetical protein